MQRVIDGVYTVTGLGFGRVYVVETANGLVLIDTSSRADIAQRLERQFRKHNFRLEDVKHILITHAHTDHIGGLPGLQRMTPARTYAHRREALIIRGERPMQFARPEDLRGFNRLILGFIPMMATPARVEVEFKGGDLLDASVPGLQVIETFGHSPGHSSFWWPEKRLLFGGDVVMNLPWGMRRPFVVANTDHTEMRRSVVKVAALDVDILCPGHGPPIVGGAAAQIAPAAERSRRELA